MLRSIAATLIILIAMPVCGSETIEGVVTVVWGDPPQGVGPEPEPLMHVTTAGGDIVRLDFDPHLFEYALAVGQGAPIRMSGEFTRDDSFHVDGMIRLKIDPSTKALTGAQPWASVLCKFDRNDTEPRILGYFVAMFDNTPGRLDHYWREVSYNNITVAGSTAVGWVSLPHPRDHYIAAGTKCHQSRVDFGGLFDDCTAAADHLIDFSDAGGGVPFVGINLMFNAELDGCAWGGGHFATLDGVSKVWRTTWEPPWGYQNVCVMAHEMGHGFGLPHSNNWDGDSSPYDNVWDVMSDSWSYAASDSNYGTIGKHTISYHKYDRLGWIPSSKVFTPPADSESWIVVDDLALPTVVNYRMARLPIPGSPAFYTVEVRGRTGHYDARLPDKAVIIHHVDVSRPEDAWAVDAAVPPAGNSAGEGTMWRTGEMFQAPGIPISVTVDGQTADGFRLRIVYGNPVQVAQFFDSFESSTPSKWSGVHP